jgi:hypothetical protein
MPERYAKPLALAILITLIAGVWFTLGEPYLDLWQDRIAQAERFERKQQSLIRLIRDREYYEQQYRALSDSDGLQRVFLENKSGSLADVKLQGIVSQIVVDSGGKLIQAAIKKNRQGTSQSRPDAEIEQDKSVTVQVTMQGSLEMIYSALHALENNRPLILVDNLQISYTRTHYRVASANHVDTSYRASYDAIAFIL